MCARINDCHDWCVYSHTNLINGKKYIGITSKIPEHRWGHNGSGYIGCTYFFNAINKYGWDNFSHEILYDGLSEEEAKNKEIELIKKYKTNDENYGYNLTAGGDGSLGREVSDETKQKIGDANRGTKHSEETKRLISERLIGNKYALGYHHTEETKRRLAEASRGNQHSKGYHHTEEMKKHLSEVHKGRPKSEETRRKLSEANKGKKLSEETRRKISLSKIGKPHAGAPHSEITKKILSEKKKQLHIDHPDYAEKLVEINRIKVDMYSRDGVYIQTFNSATDAKKELGIDNSSIGKVCMGKMKSAGGYIWKYNDGTY